MVKLKKQISYHFFSTAHFLVHALTEDPFRSEFYLEDSTKGTWSIFFIVPSQQLPQMIKGHM